MKSKHHADDEEQSKQFVAKAREIGADGDSLFATDLLLRRLAKTSPRPHRPSRAIKARKATAPKRSVPTRQKKKT